MYKNILASFFVFTLIFNFVACDEHPNSGVVAVDDNTPQCPMGQLLDEYSGECVSLPEDDPDTGNTPDAATDVDEPRGDAVVDEVSPDADVAPDEVEVGVQADVEVDMGDKPDTEDLCDLEGSLSLSLPNDEHWTCEPGQFCRALEMHVRYESISDGVITALIVPIRAYGERPASRTFRHCELQMRDLDNQGLTEIVDTSIVDDAHNAATFVRLSETLQRGTTYELVVECLAREGIDPGRFYATIPSPQHLVVLSTPDAKPLCSENILLPEGGVNGNGQQSFEVVTDEQACTTPATLHVALGSDADAFRCQPGQQGCVLIRVDLTAGNEDVRVTDLAITIAQIQGNTLVEDRFLQCELNLQREVDWELLGNAAPRGEEFLFDRIDVVIEAHNSEQLVLNCRISSAVPDENEIYAFTIEGAQEIQAENNDGNALCEENITFDGEFGGLNLDHAQTVIVQGGLPDLNVRVATNTPEPRVLLPSMQGVRVTTYETVAGLGTNYLLQELVFENCLARDEEGACAQYGDDTAIGHIVLTYTDPRDHVEHRRSGLLTNGRVTFNGLAGLLAPALVVNQFTLSVDTSPRFQVRSGQQFRLQLVEYRAVHTRTAQVATHEDFPPQGEPATHTVYLTRPTVTLAVGTPSGSAVPGLIETLRFNVSADGRGELYVRRITFRLFSTDNADSGWNGCRNLADPTKWRLRDDFDPIVTTIVFATEDGGPCGNTPEPVAYAIVTMLVEVPAGATETFHLRVDTTGASSRDNDVIRVDIPSESQLVNQVFPAFEWEDANGDILDGSEIRNLPVQGGTLVF